MPTMDRNEGRNEGTEIGMKRTNLDALSAHYRIADYKELYKIGRAHV